VLPYGRTVTRLRSGEPSYDDYGNEVPGPVTETALDGCAWSPRAGTEQLQGQDTVIVGLTLYAPPATDLLATDRVRLPDGTMWAVDGMPGSWWSPYDGAEKGVTAALTRWEG
jgi:hypothetical protein